MDKRTSGLVLIGFSLLTFVIAIGFDQLSNSIQRSAAYVKGGASGKLRRDVCSYNFNYFGGNNNFYRSISNEKKLISY